MKNISYLPLIPLVLLACQISGINFQIVNDTDIATKVAQTLALIPTQPVEDKGVTETASPMTPTAEPSLPPPTETAVPPTNTLVLPVNTETLANFASSTPFPVLSLTPSAIPPTITLSSTDPRFRFGTPESTDPLNNPGFWFWGTGYNKFSSAEFNGSNLRLTGLSDISGWRLPAVKPANNFYVEMTAVTENCTGKDNYGIIFRVPKYSEPEQGYLFAVSCDGSYKLWLWDGLAGKEGEAKSLIAWKTYPSIHSGTNKTNRIGVLAAESNISLYINGGMVGEFVDKTYSGGSFGVFIDPDTTENFSIKIDEMSYWNNPVK